MWWNYRFFYDKEILKANSNDTCLAIISLEFALNKDGTSYPQLFLKECKNIEKKWSDILLMT